ncbi:MAG TPA: hypothetical protein VFT84_08905 [Gemmatimonadales bacterium]|nr:hypothetical protein [Gemmatimonadales bacterium]
MYARRSSLLPLAAALALAACSDSTGASGDPQLRFNLASSAAAPAAAVGPSLAVAAAPVTFTDGANTLIVDQVQLVMREIELERVGDDACALVADDSCERLELGPILLDLPLGAGAVSQFTVAVDTGHYDEVELEIHKASSSDDAAFVAANPEFVDRSIRVTGSYNGNAFTFYSDLDVEQEIDLSPPLAVAEGGAADLTLFVNLDRWFRTEAGDLIDPASANKGESNEGVVKNNIQNALEAFEDEDHDGVED